MSNESPSFLPAFGVGAPGASVPHNAVYYDTSTNPYQPYIFRAGGWHTTGAGSGAVAGNATQLQGVNVSATAPTNGQVLTYVLANLDWEPKTPSGGAAPTIVQNALVAVASHATGITLLAAPTNGNLLIAFCSDTTTSPTIGAGWTMIASASAAQDGYGIAWKLAGAGESVTQVPFSDAHAGIISLFECNTAASGAFSAFTGFTSAPNITENLFNQKPSQALIVGVVIVRALVNATGFTGATADNQTTGQGRGGNNFHVTAPAQGNNAVTANYAAAQGGLMVSLALG